MSDITLIKRRLNESARDVVEYLLPRGILDGREWCVGSTQGEPGKSLKVCVAGAKVGVWTDFAEGGEGGDLVDLWQAVKGLQLGQALDDIRAWLGIEKPVFESDNRRTYKRPERPKCSAPNSAVKAYLIAERKISAQAIAAYKVGEQGRTMVFPYLVGTELYLVKFIGIDLDQNGKKQITSTADSEDILFGWNVIDANAREVTITEGEIDAMTAYDYGFPALSLPRGGGGGAKQKWIESDFDRLSRFETIYLCLDMDKAGDEAAAEIVNRLGRHRCRRVTLPRKDINECRKADVPTETMKLIFRAAQSLDPEELKRAGAFTDDVIKLFWPTSDEETGYRLPWAKIGGKVRFRPGELSIWTGPTGAGKSQVLSHATVSWGEQGARVCVASLEMKPPQLLRRMVKQAGNVDRPPEPYIRQIMTWMDDWLWCFDLVGKVDIAKMLDVFEYARGRYGCDTFVIDSLMRLGIGSEDYEGQEKAVFTLVTWAVEKNVHLHLVAHSRKTDQKSGGHAPESEDIKGASEIGSNASNIFGVYRDRKLEDKVKSLRDKVEHGDKAAETPLQDAEFIPPVMFNVAKQRNGDWEGKCGLWFDQSSYQYRSVQDNRAGFKYVRNAGSSAEAAE